MVLGAACMAGCAAYLLFLNMSSEGDLRRRASDPGRTRWDN